MTCISPYIILIEEVKIPFIEALHVYLHKLSILYKIDCVKSIYFIEKWVKCEVLRKWELRVA